MKPERIVTRVEVGVKVSNRKGVSLPDTVVPLAALAPKDIADLEAALDRFAKIQLKRELECNYPSFGWRRLCRVGSSAPVFCRQEIHA